MQQEFAERLGMHVVPKHEKYLGIPTLVGRSRNDTFAYIKDNLSKKLTGWRSKLMSAARREVLIKELHQLCAQFWWGGTDEKKGMHWRAWDTLCKPKVEGGMGFRHLFAFNLAMLAKQGWRILQNPDSLPGRLLKAIYFPHVNFWEAELGGSPSYAWRSILEGRDILRSGVGRQIGNGQNTNIWFDPWLPDVDLLQFQNPNFIRVAELFSSLGVWNSALLHELFPPNIVTNIMALPISSRGHQDRWIWSEDKKGKFTVKSAYHLARKRVLDHDTRPNPSSVLWNKLWKAPVPGKVKICAWKAASNILPTRSRLSQCGIDIDTQCSFCEEEVESPIHALRDCIHAAGFFSLVHIPSMQQTTTVHDWLALMASTASDTFHIVLMLLWAIWRNRNVKVWEDEAKLAVELVPLTLGWWSEYKLAHALSCGLRAASRATWKRPSAGFIKLNVDASFDPISGRTGLGGVFRNHEERSLGVFTRFVPLSSSPQHSELLALLEGVGIVLMHQLCPIIIETDCQTLVAAISTGSMDNLFLGFLLTDLKENLRYAANVRVIYVKREANRVAHSLAQFALYSMSTGFMPVGPPHVEELVTIECNDP